MAIDLTTASRGRRIKAPFALFYGPPGVGKTSFAAGAPNPIFARVEDGLGTLDVARWPRDVEDGGTGTFKELNEFVEFLGALLADHQPYQTLVVDSISALERLIWRQVIRDDGLDPDNGGTIEKVGKGYQRGYREAAHYWATLVQWWKALQAKGVAVILLGHADAAKFHDPMQGEYDRYSLRLHKWGSAVILEECDLVGFLLNRKALTSETGGFGQTRQRATSQRRMLYLADQPAAEAKCRYSGVAPELEIPDSVDDPTAGWAVFSDALASALVVGQPADA